MSNGVNKVIIVGRLGQDPDLRYAASGTAVCVISVATEESWKDKGTGEKQARTEWHRIKFFGKLAEIAGEYLKKGSQVYVEGSIRTDKYTDKEGVERFSTSIIASEMQMLGGKGEGGDQRKAEDKPASGGQAPRRQRQAEQSGPVQSTIDDFDDSIPF